MKIAVAVDLSVESHFALRWALDLRDRIRDQGRRARVYAVSVPADSATFAYRSFSGFSRTDEDPGVHRRIVHQIREFLESVRLDVDDVEIVVREGDPAETIAGFCDEEDVDWLSVGQSTVGMLARLLLGSTVHSLTDRASSKLAIVHPGHARLEKKAELVVAIDFLPGSESALMTAAQMADVTDGRLHLIHALEDAPTGTSSSASGTRTTADIARLADDARQSLEELMDDIRQRYPDLNYTTFVHSGPARRVITDVIDRRSADAAFLGNVEHSTVEKWLFGSVSRALLRRMPTTMVLVPPQ